MLEMWRKVKGEKVDKIKGWCRAWGNRFVTEILRIENINKSWQGRNSKMMLTNNRIITIADWEMINFSHPVGTNHPEVGSSLSWAQFFCNKVTSFTSKHWISCTCHNKGNKQWHKAQADKNNTPLGQRKGSTRIYLRVSMVHGLRSQYQQNKYNTRVLAWSKARINNNDNN